MPIEVKLPKLGDGIESGDVLEIFVREGDVIKANQDLLELETDKATVTVPSSHAGKVLSVNVKTGQAVPIGGLLVTLEGTTDASAGEAPKAAPSKDAAKPAPAKPAAPAASAKPAPAAELKPAPTPASDKPAPAPAAARSAPAETPRPAPATPAARAAEESETSNGGAVAAGPAIRRFAREVGVDLNRVPGSGEGGRITREDVLEVVRNANRTSQVPTATPAAAPRRPSAPTSVTPPGEPGSDAWGPVRTERMAKIRKTIAAKMHESWSTIPKVTNFDDADITELEKIRQDNKEAYAEAGIKLSTMPFVIKAVALALKHHPTVNASLDVANEQVIYKEYVNIGIAVDSERGLVVPSLRQADQMSIPDIARNLADLADRVRANEYTIDDLRGGTFTISNLGAIGGTYSTPIINPPEVAILLTGRARKMAVVVDDQVEIRLMMPLSLSYDHRIIDGATAARFLNDVIGYLKAPGRLLLAP